MVLNHHAQDIASEESYPFFCDHAGAHDENTLFRGWRL
jgi:hypothetical protein